MKTGFEEQDAAINCPVNIPVQMICSMSTSGRIRPIRFRFETEEHQIETVDIERMVSSDKRNYVGIKEEIFICTVIIGNLSHIIELRYNVESTQWKLFQFLS